MTYFDRDFELTESALSVVFDKLGEQKTLKLNEPFHAMQQTGKECDIVAIERVSETEVQLITTERTIPTARLETQALMDLVDERVVPGAFTLE